MNSKSTIHVVLFLFVSGIFFTGCQPDKLNTSSHLPLSKIVGGSPVAANQDFDSSKFESVVALAAPNNSIFCSGTIVHPKIVITAAHCLNAVKKMGIEKTFKIYVGNGSSSIGGQVASTKYEVESFYIHPAFFLLANLPAMMTLNVDLHDIGVVVLKERAEEVPTKVVYQFQQYSAFSHLDFPVTLAGFGIRVDPDKQTPETPYGEKYVVNSKVTFNLPGELEIFSEGKYVSKGDSGGPALVKVGQDFQLLGVTSRALFGLTRGNNSIHRFVKVSSYICWIKNVTGINLAENGPCHNMAKSLIQDIEEVVQAIAGSSKGPYREQIQAILDHPRSVVWSLIQLGKTGSVSNTIIKNLIQIIMNNENVNYRFAAFNTLNMLNWDKDIYKVVLPKIMDETNETFKQSALYWYGLLNLKSQKNAQDMLKGLDSKDDDTRIATLAVFDYVSAGYDFVLDRFLERIPLEKNSMVLNQMFSFLLKFGEGYAPFNRFNLMLLNNSNSENQKVLALKAIKISDLEGSEVTIDSIIPYLSDDSEEVRKCALSTLVNFVNRKEFVIEKLVKQFMATPNEFIAYAITRYPEYRIRASLEKMDFGNKNEIQEFIINLRSF